MNVLIPKKFDVHRGFLAFFKFIIATSFQFKALAERFIFFQIKENFMFSKKTLSLLVFSAVFASGSAWAWTQNSPTPFKKDAAGNVVKDQTGFNQLSANSVAQNQCPSAQMDGWKCMMEGTDYNWTNFFTNPSYTYNHSGNQSGWKSAYHLADDYFYAWAIDAKARNLPESTWAYPQGTTTGADGTVTVTSYDSTKTIGGDTIGGYTVIGGGNGPGYRDYQTTANSGNVAAAIMVSNLGQCGCVTNFGKNKSGGRLLTEDAFQSGQCSVGEHLASCAYQGSPSEMKKAYAINNVSLHYQKLAKACVHFWNNLVNQTINSANGVEQYVKDDQGKWVANPDYLEYCNLNGGTNNVCTVCTVKTDKDNADMVGKVLPCSDTSFVGPGLVSYTGNLSGQIITQVYAFDGTNCDSDEGKIDIVAQ